MPRPDPTPLNLSLAFLRLIQDWSQARLAKATGISAKMLSRYETGRTTLSRELLERIVAAMGLGPEAIDWSLFFLQQVRNNEEDASASPVGPTAAERRVIERTALAKALSGADEARSELARSVRNLRAEHARREAQRLWEHLKGRPAGDQRVLVEGGREYKSWALCERLCFASESAAPNDAGEAIELAELALRIAELVPGDEAWRLRLQGFAWAFLGNARRVHGNHPYAEEAFARSERLWNSGAPSVDLGLLSEAYLLDLRASFRRHQGRFQEALELHDVAMTMARPGDRGLILLSKAKTLEEMGHVQQAVDTLKQAEPFVDAQREPRRLCVLRFNLASNLCHLGKFSEAEALLPEVRKLTARLGNSLDNLRLRWLEGRVAAGLGRKDEALAALSQVRAGFTSRGIAFDTALATLGLAVVHLELDHVGEVKTLARQMLPIFEAQGGHREALAALLLFREAAEKEAATVEFAERVIDYLHRARRDPNLRFEP
jgi:transcriptional regulator with XRE-family HTH domain